MVRIALFIFAFFTYIALALAVLVPVVDGELVELDKRKTHTGKGTWFDPGLGNCGWENIEADLILAISKGLFDKNNGSNCGQYVHITDTKNGKTAYGVMVDSCQSCSNNDIEMSPALFKKFAPLSTGELTVQWHFMKHNWKP